MENITHIRDLIDNERKQEAWEELNRILTANPSNEEAWLLAYELTADSNKSALLEKAKQYLPNDSAIFHTDTLLYSWLNEGGTKEKQSKKISRPLLLGLILGGCILLYGIGFIVFRDYTIRLSSQNGISAFSSATITPHPSLTPVRTSTPSPTATRSPIEAYRTYIAIDDVNKNPDKYIGQLVTFCGEIFNIEEDEEGDIIQMFIKPVFVANGSRIPIIAVYHGDTSRIYEGWDMEIRGIVAGEIEFQNTFGTTVTQPVIKVDYLNPCYLFD